VIRHGWLFAKQWVEESADELEDDELDFTAREERIHALRLECQDPSFIRKMESRLERLD
jgi:hypothetical protein